MLKIYGANLSSPANKVRFTANLLGLEYEYIQVKIRENENKQEWFLNLNPAAKIPVIDDDGFALFESDAICKYLALKQGSSLYPKDFKKQAVVDQWVDFISIHIGGGVSRVLYNRVFAPMRGEAVDQNSIKDGLNFLNRFLPVVDKQLSKHKFVVSDEMTLADIDLLSVLDPLEVAEIDFSAYTNIIKWRRELQQKDFYQKCHKNYGETLKILMAKAK